MWFQCGSWLSFDGCFILFYRSHSYRGAAVVPRSNKRSWALSRQTHAQDLFRYWVWSSAILNKSWRQHPTRHQLYGHLPPITKTIQVRRTRHAGHCWRSRDELIRDVLLWTPTRGRAKAGRPARTYIQQLCEDTGWCPEDLPGAMNDREEWRQRVRDIRATSTTWWWWYIFMNLFWGREGCVCQRNKPACTSLMHPDWPFFYRIFTSLKY